MECLLAQKTHCVNSVSPLKRDQQSSSATHLQAERKSNVRREAHSFLFVNKAHFPGRAENGERSNKIYVVRYDHVSDRFAILVG